MISLSLVSAVLLFHRAFNSLEFERLSSCFGLTGLALDWISSYLHNRRQSVKIGDACSPPSDITSGVPQGSVLGPILFALYTSPISAIADAHGVLQQQYADDTQLYISVSAKTIAPNTRRLEALLTCMVLSQLARTKPIQIRSSPTWNQPATEDPCNARLGQHLRHHCSTHNPDQTPWCHSWPVSFIRLPHHCSI